MFYNGALHRKPPVVAFECFLTADYSGNNYICSVAGYVSRILTSSNACEESFRKLRVIVG